MTTDHAISDDFSWLIDRSLLLERAVDTEIIDCNTTDANLSCTFGVDELNDNTIIMHNMYQSDDLYFHPNQIWNEVTGDMFDPPEQDSSTAYDDQMDMTQTSMSTDSVSQSGVHPMRVGQQPSPQMVVVQQVATYIEASEPQHHSFLELRNYQESLDCNQQKPKAKVSHNKVQPNKAGTTKAKQENQKTIAYGVSIKDLMIRLGAHNIFFTKGGPSCKNPGNRYYRSVVDMTYPKFKAAVKNTCKREIKQGILSEIITSHRLLYVIGHVKRTTEKYGHGDILEYYEVTDYKSEAIIEKIGKTLRDSPKRFNNYWYWIDTRKKNKQRFGSMASTKLEEMYHKNIQEQEKIEVLLGGEQYLVDVGDWTMHQLGNELMNFEVGRDGPDEGTDRTTTIPVADSDKSNDGPESEEQSSSTGYSDSDSQASSSLSSYNNLGLVRTVHDEIAEMDFIVREAPQHDVDELTTLSTGSRR